MKESLKLLDIISPDIWFNVKKRRGVKSIPGVVASVIFVGAMISFAVLLIINFFKRDNPIVNQLEVIRDSFPRVNLVEKRILPFFALEGSDGSLLSFEQISKTVKIRGRWEMYTISADQSSAPQIQTMSIGIISCSDLMNKTNFFEGIENPEFLTATYKDNLACLDLRNQTVRDAFAVAGSGFQQSNENVAIMIDQCTGSDPQCITLSGLKLLVGWVRPFIDTSNFKIPVKYRVNLEDIYRLGDSYSYVKAYKTSDVTIEDELGPGFQNRDRSAYIRPVLASSDVLPVQGGNNERFIMEFKASNVFTKYKRIYPTLLNIVANFGGLLSLTWTIVSVLFSPVLEQEVKRSLAHSIYKVKQDEEIHEAFVVPSVTELPKPTWDLTRRVLKCCTRKKTREVSQVIQRKLKDAEDMIEENLDIIGLIEKLNMVSVLGKMFLTEHDDSIIPASSLLFYQIKKCRSTKHFLWKKLRNKLEAVKSVGRRERKIRVKTQILPNTEEVGELAQERELPIGVPNVPRESMLQRQNSIDADRPVSHSNRRSLARLEMTNSLFREGI